MPISAHEALTLWEEGLPHQIVVICICNVLGVLPLQVLVRCGILRAALYGNCDNVRLGDTILGDTSVHVWFAFRALLSLENPLNMFY